jgi:DNA-binding NtrC family response regulator
MLVMDIRLPGMDGVAAFEAIRKVLPSIPAVFMTAYASSEKAAAAAELGAISVLSKPLDIASLVVTITQSMGRAPVLIVDDDPVLLISLARALRSADIDVVTVSSMDEAARIVRQRPDRVVVADIFLNDGFGYELIHDMRVANGHRPMLLITGRTDWLRESSDHLPGVPFRCLTKPLDIDLLVGQIRHLQQTKGIV